MSGEEKAGLGVNAGSAVTDIKKDRLGREKFVLNLASVIRGYTSEKSITFGLYGAWGSGKSTLLNFLVDELDEDDDLIVARFNPWNFGDQQKLLKLFLRTFGEMLGKEDKSKDLKKAAEAVSILSDITDSVKPLSAPLKAWSRFLGKKADRLDEVEQIKEAVSGFLTASKKRIVVIIDDMDRLTAEEIRQMFQLVKAGADFDNVIYVMAFDRSIIAPALDAVSNNDGDRYLEKVINVPLNVPPMTERKSREILLQELTRYANRHEDYNWTNKRLQEILDILPVHFKTFRLINLLMNDLMVVEPLVGNDVDFTDHITLTMLKVLEPNIHNFISEHPRLFVDVMRDQFLRDDKADEQNKNHIDEMLKDRRRALSEKECVAVLSIIFPKVERLYGKNKGKEWGKREWVQAKRACADIELFNRYFQFKVDDVDLSTGDLADLRQAMSKPADFKNLLMAATDPDKLSRTLNAIDDMADDPLSIEQTRNVVGVLMDIADDLPKRVGLDDMLFGAINASIRLCRSLLVAVPDRRLRAQIVLDGLANHPDSLEMPITLVETLTSSKSEQSKIESTFDQQDIPALRKAAADLIKAKVEDFSFFADGQSVPSVYAWLLRLAPAEAVEDVRRLTVTNDDLFLKFINLFTNVSLAESFRPVPMDLKTLRLIFTDEDIENRLNGITRDGAPLKEEAERLRELFDKARAQDGKYDAWEDDQTGE